MEKTSQELRIKALLETIEDLKNQVSLKTAMFNEAIKQRDRYKEERDIFIERNINTAIKNLELVKFIATTCNLKYSYRRDMYVLEEISLTPKDVPPLVQAYLKTSIESKMQNKAQNEPIETDYEKVEENIREVLREHKES